MPHEDAYVYAMQNIFSHIHISPILYIIFLIYFPSPILFLTIFNDKPLEIHTHKVEDRSSNLSHDIRP
jgi:hypothetical protein